MLALLLLLIGPVSNLTVTETGIIPTVSFSFTVPVSDDSSRDCVTPKLCPAVSDSLMIHWRVSPQQGKRFAAPLLEDSMRFVRGAHPTLTHSVDSTRWCLVRVWPSKPNVVAPCSRVRSIVVKAK